MLKTSNRSNPWLLLSYVKKMICDRSQSHNQSTSHAAADAGLPRGVNPQADRGGEPALLASAAAWQRLARGWLVVGFCGQAKATTIRTSLLSPGQPEHSHHADRGAVWMQLCCSRGWRQKAPESSTNLGVPHAIHIPSGYLHGPRPWQW